MTLRIELLSKVHEKKNFECGNTLLDNYIRKQAKQDVNRDLSACFVLTDEKDIVFGYYTLSANSVRREVFPEELVRPLHPSYEDLPMILMGRLAVEKSMQGKGYGEVLLFNALQRCIGLSRQLGSLAVVVDPIDQKAVEFYRNYGFLLLPGTKKMFIPVKTIKELMDAGQ